MRIATRSYEDSRRMCGLDKMLADVREIFPRCSRNRLYRLQREHRLYAKRKKKFKATNDSKHKLPIAENLLNQNFKTDRAAAVWVSDISYIFTKEGWLYLASVKDIFTKQIVGWATSDNMKTDLCLQALKQALRRYRPAHGLIHHSDRGVQYCSKEYQDLLQQEGIICSMSRKGNCYDNACAETFFSALKSELINNTQYLTRAEAHDDIFWYIEVFYNRKRRHQALGYLTPAEFHKQKSMKTAA